jgi:spermidine synthase
MSMRELAFEHTELGELTLRRRIEPRLDNLEIYEVKLGEEYLMSSLFTESEKELARLGLAPLGGDLDVVIGGLGLGYTAAETLKNGKVSGLLVIDRFQAVIDWHLAGVVPLGSILTQDSRCELRQGDFFKLAEVGFDELDPARRFDSVLVDIDHSPEHYLDENSRSFYTAEGLATVKDQLKPGGTFGLWSNDPVNDGFTKHLQNVFGFAAGHNIEFPNPYTGATSVNSIYIARKALI